jgi:hypothetical protein
LRSMDERLLRDIGVDPLSLRSFSRNVQSPTTTRFKFDS